MKSIIFVSRCGLALLIALTAGCRQSQKEPEMKASVKVPVAEKIEKELTVHGDTRVDPYYWLRERENPKVIAYLEAENAYTEAMLKDTEKLREKLFDEIVGRIKKDDSSVPYLDNGYYYYTRYEEGKEYAIHCRRKGNMDAEEEVMLDENLLAAGHDFFSLGGLSVSMDNRRMVYGTDTVGRRKYTLYIMDLEAGELSPETIPLTTGQAAWANDNRTIFYTHKDDETLRSNMIFRHVLGTGVDRDRLVYHEKDEAFSTFVYKTKSDKYLVIGSSSTVSDEYRFLDADDPQGEFRILQERERDLEYSIGHFRDHFYIITNLGARNFRLMRTPVTATSKENWEEVIPHREDVYLSDIELFNDFLVVAERKEGLINLRVISWETGQEHYLDFGEEVYVAGISVNPQFDTKILRYSYSSLTTPNSIYDYNMETRGKKLMKREEVLGGFDPANYESKRLHALADDGTPIPISIVYRRGMKRNGKNPCLLFGYGSYGHTMDPYFRSPQLSLLDRGFIFGIAHIRGGQINGRQWYEDGKLLKKMNTFTDFNDCTEYLVSEKYTNPDKLFAMGGSAGGLLMGVIVNLQPELYRGIVASVPFVDIVTTMLDEDIPLTTGEYDEWGDPGKKEYYEYMLGYSPYDNVEAKDYPNMLVTAGLHDSQVQYWEPAKWVAKLRDMKTDDHLLLLHTNMDAGHGGQSGRFRRFRETAMEYAFFLKLAGIKK
jgi:oligopeptidase B